MEAFGKIIYLFLFIAFLFYSCFTWGFISYKFYYWFVFSQFSTLPELTIPAFIGIMLFLNAILPKNYNIVKEEYKMDVFQQFIIYIISPWIVLLIGYLFKLIIF